MLGLSRLAGGGLLLLVLALLPLALDGKPAPLPQALPRAPAGGMRASRREVTEEQQEQPSPVEESSGPATEPSGSKDQPVNGCFGLKLAPVGIRSGLGCGGHVPKPTPDLKN